MDTVGREHLLDSLTEENKRLQITIEELSILNDISTAISSTQSLEQIQALIIRKCVKYLHVAEGIIMLLNNENSDRPFETMIRKKNTLFDSLPFKLDSQLMGYVLKNKTALLVNNFKESKFYENMNEENTPIINLLCVPMFIKGRIIGLLTLFNKNTPDGFSNDDQRLLSICATQSAQVIENARLYQEEQKLQKIKAEMKLAREIQNNLLPKTKPLLLGYDVSGTTLPAKEVGGDYFDFFPLPDNRYAILLGDISGKGIPAAMLMSNLQGVIRSQSLTNKRCSDCITNTNRIIYNSTEDDKFATLFYSILDYENHQITYCSAGHENPIFISGNNEPVRLLTEDIILGIMPDFQFTEKRMELKPGDLIVIYSDGVTEAENEQEQQFGITRLTNLVRDYKDLSATNLANMILGKVEEFSGNTPQMDDKTIIVIKRE